MVMGAASVAPPTPTLKDLVTLVILFSLHTWVSYGVSDNSSQALLKFKSSLSYAKAFDTWIEASTNPCSGNYGTWHGVLCFNNVVWGLQLENMGLSGQIDVDSLVALRSLRSISLMKNDFEGPMPDWRKLGALKSLFLSDNHFSGQIPKDTFENMTSLKKVYLANNKFIGSIPSSLARPRLLELRLENNGFTGPIPDFRQGLKVLNLSNNQLEGPIPQNLIKFDPTSFTGNKDLCGKPLESLCPDPNSEENTSPVQPPITSTIDSHPKKGASIPGIIIIVIAGIVAAAAVLILLAICGRSRKEAPQLGRVVSSSTSLNEQNLHSTKSLRQVGPTDVSDYKTLTPDVNNSSKKSESSKLSFVREDRQQFDLQDLLRASAEVLGSGNFGSSYKAVLMDGQAVVVKRFKQMNNVGREEFHEHMRRLGRLVHPNLLPLVAYYYRKEEKLLVFDYVQNGSLASHLHGNHSAEKPALDWPTRLNIIKGVAKGLAYLHTELPVSLSIPHGHLKSSNVVLDKSFQPLLMDYGLVPVVNHEQVQQLLVAYKSPEYTQHGRTTRKSDVWNLGILILEILTSKFPTNYLTQDGAGYYGSQESTIWTNFVTGGEDSKRSVFDAEMGNTENCEEEMRKLLKIGMACCEQDVDKRWDLKEAIEEIEAIKERDF